MSLFKSNNAFYQSDPDFSNDDSEPRLREQVDPYKVRQLLAEENKSRLAAARHEAAQVPLADWKF